MTIVTLHLNKTGEYWLRLLSVTLILTLPACSHLRSHGDRAAFPLLAPSTLGSSRDALQLIQGAINENDVAFQSVVNVRPEQLTLIGLSAQGQRLFALSYDGHSLQSRISQQMPERLNPQYVLADLQLALWPLPALQKALADTSWQVTEPTPATRRLRRDGRLVAEVHYADPDPWRGRLWLSNFEYGYSFAIESQALP